jgi:hypothetical protein
MTDRIAGYHFDMQFGAVWTALAPNVVERAGAAGIAVSGAGHELQPRAWMLRACGTRWAGLRAGDIHFQIIEYRDNLDGWLIQEPCVTSKQELHPFGVRIEHKGWTSTKLSKAVGLWLRGGSLLLRTFQNEQCLLDETVLADFDMWQALDALARFAAGEPSFGSPSPQAAEVAAGRPLPYAAPTWAQDFEVTARAESAGAAKAHASFNNPRYVVGGSVTLMERS